MDFTIPKETIGEDAVHSTFFPISPVADNLEELCESLNRFVSKLSEGYIWHRDEFKILLPLISDKTDLPRHLISVTCFGDNIEDEWFIIYLLLEISREYQNLVIKVRDNDGELLLIEAADVLPSWANPDTTENRVFIYQNHIHFVQLNILNTDSDLNVHEAIKIICDTPEQTKCPEIQQVILKRIGEYPKKIADNIHHAVVQLPLNIATLLSVKPCLISPIVNTFCSHDVIDAKACKNIKIEDCVLTTVKFTKCLYAMLIHSKPITVLSKRYYEGDKKSALGIKITCGYEIIMNNLSGDVFSSKEFNIFLKSLTQNGYFKGNMESSKEYKKLLYNAKEFFVTMECPVNTQVSSCISDLMQTSEFLDMKEILKKQSSQENFTEDSDDWLKIHPDQLNNLLNSRYGRQAKFKTGDVIDSHTITSELSNFLKQSSDFEGIETNKQDSEEHIEFDSELFVKSLKQMMNIISPDNDIVESDFDDDDFENASLPEEALDMELKDKLNTEDNIGSQNSKQIMLNIMQSIKEEGGASGPSSNILKTIGLNKTDILDSDDDEC